MSKLNKVLVPYGKYKGLEFSDALAIDPRYFEWLKKEK